MSTAFAPNVGEVRLLELMLNKVPPTNPVLRLYSNPSGPVDENTDVGNLTEVATSTGYAPITLPGSGWTITTLNNNTTAVHPQVTFTFNTSVQARGIYVTNASNQMLWMEKFDGDGFTLPGSGGEIAIDPTVTLE